MFHPDKNPDETESNEAMKKINAAYRVLRDPEKRAGYDDLLRQSRAREKASENKGNQQENQSEPPATENVNPNPAASDNKPKKNFNWPFIASLIVSTVLVKLIGAIGAITFFIAFYGLYPKRGAIVSIAAAGFSSLVITFSGIKFISTIAPREVRE